MKIFLLKNNYLNLLSLLCIFCLAPLSSFAAGDSLFDPSNFNFTSKTLQLLILLTVLSVAPSILIMVTSFTRIIVVFSFIRNALGLQQSPPNFVLVSLAMFLTFFIMSPTFEKAYIDGVKPLLDEKIDEFEAFKRVSIPFAKFMKSQTREKDLELFYSISNIKPDLNYENIPLKILTPAFMISELKRSFEIGFLIFLPFLIIDLLIASILMAMGMMMVPPVMISFPFKIAFFILVDGWYLLCGGLIKSFVQ